MMQFVLFVKFNQYYADYNIYPRRLYADSGYYSLDNYRYMAAAGIENYIKPQTWQKMICGEWMELYHFDENKNLICLNGKIASRCQLRMYAYLFGVQYSQTIYLDCR